MIKLLKLRKFFSWCMNAFIGNKSQQVKAPKYEIGTFIIHIPEFVDHIQVGQIIRYDKFGHPVTNTFLAIGYTIPYSPVAFDAIMKLSPLQRLAIFSEQLLPIYDIDRTLNFETLDRGVIEADTIRRANEWYASLPINQIEIISDYQKGEPSTAIKKIRKKRIKKTTPVTPRVKKPTGIVESPPEL